MSGVSVFVVDDHPLMLSAIVSAIERHFTVVGSADNVGAAIELILERGPDVVLLDVNLDFGGGQHVIKAVRAVDPRPRFLAFTALTSRRDVARMFAAGVDGYITKSSTSEEIVDAVGQVLAGQRPVSSEIAGHLLDIDDGVPADNSVDRLTPRERQVCERIAMGDTYRECAARLGISVKTLENHMDHIFRKLAVQSRHELTRRLLEDGFLRSDDRDPAGG